jgi:hypothetical protein
MAWGKKIRKNIYIVNLVKNFYHYDISSYIPNACLVLVVTFPCTCKHSFLYSICMVSTLSTLLFMEQFMKHSFLKQITKPFFMYRTHCLFWDISARFAKQDLFSRWNSFLSRNIFLERLTIWLIDWFLMFNVTFSNISAISWRPVLVVEEARVPGENHRPWASNW